MLYGLPAHEEEKAQTTIIRGRTYVGAYNPKTVATQYTHREDFGCQKRKRKKKGFFFQSLTLSGVFWVLHRHCIQNRFSHSSSN